MAGHTTMHRPAATTLEPTARNCVREAREHIWEAERLCFDEVASGTAFTTLAPATLRRFGSNQLRPAFYQEYMIRAAGDLSGKRVLDLGCGRGNDAILLAKLGAQVTGLDVSGASVEFVKRRAEAEGVADVTTFLCSPVETAPLPEHVFDVIWCHNILHHLTHTLDFMLALIKSWAKPGGRLVLTEPVDLCRPLERLQQLLPSRALASTGEDTWTGHERPLGWTELATIRRHLPGLTTRHFACLGRLERFVLSGGNYELSSRPRKAVAWLLVHSDYPLLSVPYLRNIGRRVVMHGCVKAAS